MKKLLFGILASTSLIACTSTEKKSETAENQPAATIEHIYKPTYSNGTKMGDQKNVLLIEQFHQALFAKDFNKVGNFLVDTAQFYGDDGTIIKGKSALIDYMQKTFTPLDFKNFSVAVSMSVIGDNNQEWVLVWDNADVVLPDGKSQKFDWMDAFRVENGKIISFNGFAKSPKN
jgi:ketosteroid isomerase-like protein